jgi:hypothetical protein
MKDQAVCLDQELELLAMSSVRGYELGEIDAAAAFTCEFILAVKLGLKSAVNMQETERRSIDARAGIFIKYLPASRMW